MTIIATTVPALVVFATIYYLMKQFFQHQTQLRLMEMENVKRDTNIPQKIQAYERLTLFCERIRIPNLLMRLSSTEKNPEGILHALLISVQKEYEHNITQQIYVSENLWKIISLAKNEILSIINQSYADVQGDSVDEFRNKLLFNLYQLEYSPVEQALSAIHSEAKLFLS